jgi:hypothetical protein
MEGGMEGWGDRGWRDGWVEGGRQEEDRGSRVMLPFLPRKAKKKNISLSLRSNQNNLF